MTYAELLEEAKQHISSKIIDYRPACGLYVDGMDGCDVVNIAEQLKAGDMDV